MAIPDDDRRPGPSEAHRRAKARDVAVLRLIEVLQQQGITSARALAKALNEQGLHAPGGGHWQATQVIRVIRRAADD